MPDAPTPSGRPRRGQPRGDRAREAILRTAMTQATVDGLDGLSLGRLAGRLGVSKAGLFAHFASKEDLQLATIDFAASRFQTDVVEPVVAERAPLRRLWLAHLRHLDWIADSELPGGCFFTNAQFEFDMRPGPVRDRLAGVLAGWLSFLSRLAASAVRAGELRAGADPEQLAFEINAFGTAVVYQSRLDPDADAYARSRRAVLHRLRELATDPDQLPPGET